MKKIMLLLTVSVLVIGMMAMSFADARFGPAAIYGGLTNVTEDEAYALKLESGLTFGEMAEEAGVYDAFHDAAYDAKVVMIDEMVASGDISQVEADEILTALADCDGTQSHILQNKLGFGQQNGQGQGQGLGQGNGNGRKLMDGTGAAAGTQTRGGGQGKGMGGNF